MTWTALRTWTTGEIVRAVNLNTNVRDNENHVYRQMVRKTADESTSSTSFQADDELFWQIKVGETWRFYIKLFYISNNASTQFWQIAMNGPGITSFAYGGLGPDFTTITNIRTRAQANIGDSFILDFGMNNTQHTVIVEGVFVGATTAGTCNLRWASGIGTTTITVKAGSYMLLDRIS